MNILDYKRTLLIVGISATAMSGACLGYLYGLKESEKGFNEALETVLKAEIDKTRRFYATRYKDVEPSDVSELPDAPVVDEQHFAIPKEMLNTPEGRAAVMAEIEKAIEPELVPVNAFDVSAVPDVDENALMAARSSDAPYVVSSEEFHRNDAHYESFLLTFFEGDGILMDDQEDIIPDIESVVGEKNMQLFGVMSGDPMTVYIQNDMSESLFMVTRTHMSAKEALYGSDEEDVSG